MLSSGHQPLKQIGNLPAMFLFAILLQLHNIDTLTSQDAEVLRQKTTIEISKGKLTRKHLWEIQINNRNGEKYTNVSIPWSGLVKVENIQAMITDQKGNVIRKLDKRSISERSDISSISLYEDSFVNEFTLRHNIYPYNLTYSYDEHESQFIWIDMWVPVLSPEIPTHRAVLELIVPVGYKFSYRSQAGYPAAREISKNRTYYIWETSHKEIIPAKETNSPPVITLLPHVKIVPVEFFFERKGSLESWITFGNWQTELTGQPEGLPDAEKRRIDKLVSGVDDPRQKLMILYHYLQDNTRYINVSIETGGLKPHPVSYVVNNRYGDCKALSNYFRSVLHYAGIRSFYSKIYAGDGFIETDKSFPSQSFNHIILCVPVEGDTLWIDCTSDLPAGYTGTFIQNRDVFVVENDASHFLKTPKLAPSDVEEIRVFEVESKVPPSATINITMTLRGNKYELLRSVSKSAPEKDRQTIITDKFLPTGLNMLEYSIDPVHRDSSYIILNIQAESNRFFRFYGVNIVTSVPPFSLPRLEDPNSRKSPLRMEYPLRQTDSLTVIIPSGYSLISLPADTLMESAVGSYSSYSLIKGDSVSVTRQVVLNAGNYAGDQYGEVYAFIRKIRDVEMAETIIARKN